MTTFREPMSFNVNEFFLLQRVKEQWTSGISELAAGLVGTYSGRKTGKVVHGQESEWDECCTVDFLVYFALFSSQVAFHSAL